MAPHYPNLMLLMLTLPANANLVQLVDLSCQIHSQTLSQLPPSNRLQSHWHSIPRPPATSMIFLGVLVNTSTNFLTVAQCSIGRSSQQSLLGVMSYVMACVCPARVFMSTLLNTLHSHKSSTVCSLSHDNKADLRWWCYFLPFYNGVPIRRLYRGGMILCISPPTHVALVLAVFFDGQYCHMPFPHFVLHQFGHDINTLELLTIMAALKLWATFLPGRRLVLQCDNKNSVLALNSGCSHSTWNAMLFA